MRYNKNNYSTFLKTCYLWTLHPPPPPPSPCFSTKVDWENFKKFTNWGMEHFGLISGRIKEILGFSWGGNGTIFGGSCIRSALHVINVCGIWKLLSLPINSILIGVLQNLVNI